MVDDVVDIFVNRLDVDPPTLALAVALVVVAESENILTG